MSRVYFFVAPVAEDESVSGAGAVSTDVGGTAEFVEESEELSELFSLGEFPLRHALHTFAIDSCLQRRQVGHCQRWGLPIENLG
jgi:hypothetical protein